MRAIFISYRREDTEGQAGRLYDDLATQFGEDSVFMDVAGIEPGRDFRRAIDEQVASCGVLLALIGKRWLDAGDESGRRRLDDPMDFVRVETTSALRRDIPVIPVLVQGASMPRAEQLPPDMAELAYRNGVELSHARWDSDLQVLIRTLRPHVALSPRRAKTSWRLIVAVSVAVMALALGGYVVYEKSAKTGKQDGPAAAGNVNAGGASGTPVPVSDVASNGNANTQTKDPRKQESADNRNGPSASSVATPVATSQPSPGQQIANRRLMLVNAKTGKCLTVRGTGYNVEAMQFDCDGDPSRRWTLREMAGGGVYQIRNVQTGMCLTIAGGESTGNNVPALQYECDDDPSRTWRISDVTGSGVYQVENVKTGKCLTIAGGVSAENNVQALQYNCDDDLSRRWRVRLGQ
jgi:hypothetical protein